MNGQKKEKETTQLLEMLETAMEKLMALREAEKDSKALKDAELCLDDCICWIHDYEDEQR